jgi:hypothetical protein
VFGPFNASLIELATMTLIHIMATGFYLDLPNQPLLSILSSICKLLQTALVDAVNLLPNRPGSQLRVRVRHGHGAMAITSHVG